MNEKGSGSRSRKQRLTVVGTRCADHVTPLYPQKLALTSPTGGDRSVGIVRVLTKATEFLVYPDAQGEGSKICAINCLTMYKTSNSGRLESSSTPERDFQISQ